MKREQAIEIAQSCAKAKPQSYYAEPFQPHEWVIDAIQLGVRLYGAQSLPPTRLRELRERIAAPIGDLIAYHEKEAKDHVSSQWIYGNHMNAVRAYKKSLEIFESVVRDTLLKVEEDRCKLK